MSSLREAAIEEQVAGEICLVAAPEVEQHQDALREKRIAAKASPSHVLGRESPDVLARVAR